MRLLTTILLVFLSTSAFTQLVEIKKAEGVANFQSVNAITTCAGEIIISGSPNLIKVTKSEFSYIVCPFDEKGVSTTIALAQDSDENIWASASNGKMGFFNGEEWTVFDDISGSQAVISTIAFDDDNGVWALGDNKLFHYLDAKEWVLSEDYAISGDVKDMCWQNDTLWLAVENEGLVKFHNKITEVFPINDLAGQNSDLSVAIDSNGLKWVSSADFGVASFDGSEWKAFPKTEFMFLENLSRVYVDNKERIWVCSETKGVSYYNGVSWRNMQVNDGLFTNEFSALGFGDNGNVWFCSETGVCNYSWIKIANFLSDANLVGDYFATQYFDSQDRMWISTYDGTTVIDSLNTADEILDEAIKATYFTVIKEDRFGNIWAGTLDGLWRFEGGVWTRFTTDEGLIHNSINDIEIDGENNVWCATVGGVSKFNNEFWVNYGETDGLSGPSVSYISIDNNANVWASSFGLDNSLSVFNGEYWNKIESEMADSVYILAMEIDLDNALWLGTTNGLYRYRESAWSGFLLETDAGSNISSITVDPRNNLLILNEGQSVVSFDGETVAVISSFESFAGKLKFDNQGYLWGRKGDVIQRGRKADAYLKISDRYRVLEDGENKFTFKIIANNTSWKIESEDWWLSASPAAGDGDSIVTVLAEPSYEMDFRSADLKISGTDVFTQSLKVIQKTCSSVGVNELGGDETLIIKNNDGMIIVDGVNYSHCEVYNVNGVKLIHSKSSQVSLDDYVQGVFIIKAYNKDGSFIVQKTINY